MLCIHFKNIRPIIVFKRGINTHGIRKYPPLSNQNKKNHATNFGALSLFKATYVSPKSRGY
jgi:hypothetical protein